MHFTPLTALRNQGSLPGLDSLKSFTVKVHRSAPAWSDEEWTSILQLSREEMVLHRHGQVRGLPLRLLHHQPPRQVPLPSSCR